MTDRQTDRQTWIDVSKEIGILLIIFGHILESGVFRIWIYSFHVPLFFVISGMTYRLSSKSKQTGNEQIKAKFERLITPYFAFGGFSYLYWLFIERKFRADTNVPVYKPLWGLFWGSGSDNLTFNAALWFLPCLFIVFCLFIFLQSYLREKKSRMICYIALIVVGAFIGEYLPIRLPWGFDIALFALLFLLFGYCIYSYLKNINEFSIYIKIGLAIALLTINIPFAIWNGVTGMASLIYGNVFLFIVAAISGSLFVIMISQIIESNIYFEFLGRNSIIIMCIHEPIRRIVIKILSVLLGVEVTAIRNSILYSLLVCLIVISIVSPACIIINNKMKWMLGIKNKSI